MYHRHQLLLEKHNTCNYATFENVQAISFVCSTCSSLSGDRITELELTAAMYNNLYDSGVSKHPTQFFVDIDVTLSGKTRLRSNPRQCDLVSWTLGSSIALYFA